MSNHHRRPLMLAHRGTSILAPENTAPAFDFGVHYGADVLEIDVRLSRDGDVIVTHDENVDRTTNGSGKVADLRLSALKQLDAAFRFDIAQARAVVAMGGMNSAAESEYVFDPRQRVQLLTLGELYLMYPQVTINIDVKDNSALAVDAVAREVSRYQAAGRSVVASFHDAVLHHCRKHYPWITTSAGMNDVKRFYGWYLTGQRQKMRGGARLFQLPTRYYFIPLASRRFIDAVHDSGAQVNYWTINEPVQMRELLNKRADGLVTDRMDLARKVLNSGSFN